MPTLATGQARPLLLQAEMISSPAPPLLVDHAHVDRKMQALREAVAAKDATAVRDCFDLLERQLLEHFAAEERDVFPAHAAIDPDDVTKLNSEHRHIRELLTAGRAAASDGQFTSKRFRELQAALSLHQAHEETRVYR